MEVKPITDKAELRRWVETKHYARRLPPVQFSFGIYDNDTLYGVVTYAPPASPQVARSVVSSDFQNIVLELNRLVVDSYDKNMPSRLIAGSLRLLDAPRLVVSYADSGAGHVGYVYQATNWLYCGTATAHDSEYLVDGKKVHPRTLAARGITAPAKWAKENGIEKVRPQPKHRYIFICGSKTQRKRILKSVKWPHGGSYPKGDSLRHDPTPDAVCNTEAWLL